MKFRCASLNMLKKLAQALADTDASQSAELQKKITEEAAAQGSPSTLSGTSMALSPLGLLDRMDSGNNLSM